MNINNLVFKCIWMCLMSFLEIKFYLSRQSALCLVFDVCVYEDVCVHMYVCTYVCLWVRLCAYVSGFVFTCLRTYICKHTWGCVCMCACVDVCTYRGVNMHAHVYVRMLFICTWMCWFVYVHICICTYMYMCMNNGAAVCLWPPEQYQGISSEKGLWLTQD